MNEPNNVRFEAHDDAQPAHARFGRLRLSAKRSIEMPSVSLTPRIGLETDAICEVAAAGAEIPTITIPLSRARSIKGGLAPLLGPGAQQDIVRAEPLATPGVIVDVEAEAFHFPCQARQQFAADGNVPKSVAETLMKSYLRTDNKKHQTAQGARWDQFMSDYHPAVLGDWLASKQREAGSFAFLAPGPMVRSSVDSVQKAFQYSWDIVESVHLSGFKAAGVHLAIHAEILKENHASRLARAELQKQLDSFGSLTTGFPVLSFKIIDREKQIPTQAVMRLNLHDIVSSMRQSVQANNGLLVAQDTGTWALAFLYLGCDIVGARCDGNTMKVDSGFGMAKKKKRRSDGKPILVSESPRPQNDSGPATPWDPVAMSEARLTDVMASWNARESFAASKYVAPAPVWEQPRRQQELYWTKHRIGGFLEVGSEFRAAGRDHRQLLDHQVRSRVARLREQDPIMDLCQLT